MTSSRSGLYFALSVTPSAHLTRVSEISLLFFPPFSTFCPHTRKLPGPSGNRVRFSLLSLPPSPFFSNERKKRTKETSERQMGTRRGARSRGTRKQRVLISGAASRIRSKMHPRSYVPLRGSIDTGARPDSTRLSPLGRSLLRPLG